MQVLIPFFLKRRTLLLRIAALLVAVAILFVVLSQTVFAEYTYVITDGNTVRVHTTSATDPAAVLTEAGVSLNEDDIYTTQAVDGVSEITVQRSQLVTISNCGVQLQVTSYGETLESLLNRLGIPAYGKYRVSESLDTVTYDGMEVTVDHIVEAEEVYTADIPYNTTYSYDDTMPEGETAVLVPGSVGQMRCTASVIYVNAQEESRTVIGQSVIQQPVDRVISVGTGKAETVEEVSTGAPIIGDGMIITASGEVLTYYKVEQYKATAYTKTDAGCDDYTATGTYARVGAIAVDPKVIPYGTRMFIVSNDGAYIYGIATAEDCGGGIKGDRIDLYFDTTDECWQFGVRNCTVYFLG